MFLTVLYPCLVFRYSQHCSDSLNDLFLVLELIGLLIECGEPGELVILHSRILGLARANSSTN